MAESLSRLKHIFSLSAHERYSNIPVYYLSGNHDIGYGILHSRRAEAIKRYEKEFGSRNHRFAVGKVEFIAIDAQTIDDVQAYPRVLLTHIPLYRQDWTDCGPIRILRSADGQEVVYQNYITKESSKYLLDSIQPVLVLSGHDHDQCHVIHESKYGPVGEYTVGTVSWQQGNLYPSFMYLSLFALSLLALLLWPSSGVSVGHHFSDLMGLGKQLISSIRSRTKEKNEDLNCEYEMIWDAEGSMHLVKKALSTPIARTSEKNLVERGTAVMRPTARKNSSQEIEVTVNADTDTDAMAKLLPRASRSWTKRVIKRLVRTFRMVIIIAAVNNLS
ncbi:Calcineurin-like metallo-phosphoesterase superfamily protein [Prunus dulcis]|uniref:Calcineurin-like metallo-phosphoesterase superfamily protein n=1 Tax=Prunus dulcis TaxID=3755 RepID=A0A4Y1R3P3_PRUDU|nr:Calcineurin-like metallo-phosphoesterase superfamily protein [Prunus dulcis]